MMMQQEVTRSPQIDLLLISKEVEKAAQEAGRILLTYYEGELSRSYKGDGSFATQADIAAEQHLIKALQPLVPGAGFYAEESGIVAGNDYAWVIDPLDGTTNFAHGVPYFCTAIALTYKQEPVLGVIYQPLLKHLFSAQKGNGAYLNGERISVLSETRLTESLLAVWFDTGEASFALGKEMPSSQFSFRNPGAGALDLAYCAAGRFDACFYQGAYWWDYAAGALLIEEAGGKVSTFHGERVNPGNRTFVGGNEPIFTQLSPILRKTFGV